MSDEMTKTTVPRLADELGDAYQLIEDCILLALRCLKAGDASLEEQRQFWHAVEMVEQHIDLFDDMNSPDPFDHGPVNLRKRMEQLADIVIDETTIKGQETHADPS